MPRTKFPFQRVDSATVPTMRLLLADAESDRPGAPIPVLVERSGYSVALVVQAGAADADGHREEIAVALDYFGGRLQLLVHTPDTDAPVATVAFTAHGRIAQITTSFPEGVVQEPAGVVDDPAAPFTFHEAGV